VKEHIFDKPCDDTSNDEPSTRRPTEWDRSIRAMHWFIGEVQKTVTDFQMFQNIFGKGQENEQKVEDIRMDYGGSKSNSRNLYDIETTDSHRQKLVPECGRASNELDHNSLQEQCRNVV